MNDERSGLSEAIRERFPKLRAIKAAPSLGTLNGIGACWYGNRDRDPETQTYVKTRFFCLLYLPLFAMDAYRVRDAGSAGWAVLGKEPLSNFARNWNLSVIGFGIAASLMLAWNSHVASPPYRAQQELKRADQLVEKGRPLDAATIYRQQTFGPLSKAATIGLTNALTRCVASDDPKTVLGAFRLLTDMPEPGSVFPEASSQGMQLVGKFRAQCPEEALDLLNLVARLQPKTPDIASTRLDLLKRIVATNPSQTNRVIELALAYEENKASGDALRLLLPYQDRLGTTEGARLLGQLLLREGQHDVAYGLLFPYVQVHLGRLHALEIAYSNTVSATWQRIITDLNTGRADRSFYSRYQVATGAEKQGLVDEYAASRMKQDPACLRALASLKEANCVVPVALDLGIAQLNRAQGLNNPGDRQKELQAAERTFLAIQGFAGEIDEYRLFLGQVYYWLGKSQQGKELFDALLASRQRSYSILVTIASTLREVGETTTARTLCEEAFKAAKDKDERHRVALFRSTMCESEEDRLAWLEKADPQDLRTVVELTYGRARLALQQGDRAKAAGLLRQAIEGYQKMPRSAGTLNNNALAHFALYEATGEVQAQRRGMVLLDEAIALAPDDSVLTFNAAHSLFEQALHDLLRDHVHPAALAGHVEFSALGFLYLNEIERARIMQQLESNESFRKGMIYLDRALTLAPKELRLYQVAVSIYGLRQDLAALQKLAQRLRAADPDLSEIRRLTLEAYTGQKDEEHLAHLQARIRTIESALTKPGVCDFAHSREFLNVQWLALRQEARMCGEKRETIGQLQIATQMLESHASVATRHALMSVHLVQASEELAHRSPEYQALVEQLGRALPAAYLLALVLERGGPLSELALQNEQLRKAIRLQKQIQADLPRRVDALDWALLRRSDPEAAVTVGGLLRTNAARRLVDDLVYQMNPLNAAVVLEQYWRCKIANDEPAATALYRKALEEGVPLPPL